MKRLIAAVLFGLVFSIPTATSQSSGFSQRGKVSQKLRAEGLSIAHSSLPLNSKAKMVNTLTGKEIEVTIIRQIPASENQIADISLSAWQELGLTSDTDVRIYTNAAVKPQNTALAALKPQEPAAEIVQAETPPPANQQPRVVFDNNYIDSGQAAPPALAYETRAQAARPAPPVETRWQPPPPDEAYETQPPVEARQQAPQAAAAYETRAQPAPVVETYAQAPQPSAAYETRAQPAPVVETRAQAPQPSAAYETRAQPVPPVVSRPQAAPPAMVSDMWAQAARLPASVESPRQAAQPASAGGSRPQAVPAVSVSETRTQDSWTFVIIDAPPQAPRPSVIIDNGPPLYLPPPVRVQGR